MNYRFIVAAISLFRQEDTAGVSETVRLQLEMVAANGLTVRELVLEVVRPVYGSNRIMNVDNYYAYVQLLQALRLKGLYARGTVRGSTRHFRRIPTVLDPKTADHRQEVPRENSIMAST